VKVAAEAANRSQDDEHNEKVARELAARREQEASSAAIGEATIIRSEEAQKSAEAEEARMETAKEEGEARKAAIEEGKQRREEEARKAAIEEGKRRRGEEARQKQELVKGRSQGELESGDDSKAAVGNSCESSERGAPLGDFDEVLASLELPEDEALFLPAPSPASTIQDPQAARSYPRVPIHPASASHGARPNSASSLSRPRSPSSLSRPGNLPPSRLRAPSVSRLRAPSAGSAQRPSSASLMTRTRSSTTTEIRTLEPHHPEAQLSAHCRQALEALQQPDDRLVPVEGVVEFILGLQPEHRPQSLQMSTIPSYKVALMKTNLGTLSNIGPNSGFISSHAFVEWWESLDF